VGENNAQAYRVKVRANQNIIDTRKYNEQNYLELRMTIQYCKAAHLYLILSIHLSHNKS